MAMQKLFYKTKIISGLVNFQLTTFQYLCQTECPAADPVSKKDSV